MKKTIQIEVRYCDKCGSDELVRSCLMCGLDACYSCQDKHGKIYHPGVHTWGRGDGFYCHECDAKLSASRADALHNAFKAIEQLRQQMADSEMNFQVQSEAAHRTLNSLLQPHD